MNSIVEKFLEKDYMFRQGNKLIAKTLNAPLDEIIEARKIAKKLRKQDKKAVVADYISALEERVLEVNKEKGTLKSETVSSSEPKTDQELADLHKIDLTKYKISNYWTKQKSNGKFTSSIFCTLIKTVESTVNYSEEFLKFLKDMPPAAEVAFHPYNYLISNPNGTLILPKQDAHFNKHDISGGNDIETRFGVIEAFTSRMVQKAVRNYNLQNIVYVVGSDEFNSEWTGLTTKGTPQDNILSYQESFKAVCNHEIRIIDRLLHSAENVHVMYIPGNHDEYVGWHLINWLQSYYRTNTRLLFNSMTANTKYFKYSNTGVMFNHGDDMKPRDLAAKFPIGFKDQWSQCDHFHIFTGDRHTEMVTEIGGIKIHRISQLSTAKGKWDDKKGFENRAEMTGFLITEGNGMGDIYKEVL